jgi:hypothetical protein
MKIDLAILTIIGKLAALLEGLAALGSGAAPAKTSFNVTNHGEKFLVQITITKKA